MERRLAAILLTDMVGYSRLIGLDEEGTITRQKAHRAEIIDPKISEHGGRIVKSTGDGLLAEFPSVVDAVNCALGVQSEMAASNTDVSEDRRIRYRIGINLGDIVIDGEDILGDGVNVAARLEALAKPGGICISGAVYDQLAGKVDMAFEDAGEQEVKNVSRPVRVWQWQSDQPAAASLDFDAPLALPDKPSIAVMPFENMSGDAEQEYFADGIAEDVITALSRFRSLFVIARNSSFTYKGGAVGISEVGRQLGVRYVVQGSVRKAGVRVRITAQLIDTSNGRNLWADRFEGTLENVFDLQDQIAEQIVVSVEPEVQAREREHARRKRPDSLDAWELVQRGLWHFYRKNEKDRAEAIRLFRTAIALDPESAAARAQLAYALWGNVVFGYAKDPTSELALARASAEQAVSLDPNDSMARFSLGRPLTFAGGETNVAIGEMEAAIAINPNFALGHYGLGYAYHFGAGHAQRALQHLDAALRLSPRDPWRWLPLMTLGSALRELDRYDEAIARCRQSCQFPDTSFLPHMHLAATLAEAGQKREAKWAVEKAIQLQPSLSISFIRGRYAGMHDTVLNRLLDSLRKAGLPE